MKEIRWYNRKKAIETTYNTVCTYIKEKYLYRRKTEEEEIYLRKLIADLFHKNGYETKNFRYDKNVTDVLHKMKTEHVIYFDRTETDHAGNVTVFYHLYG